MINASKENAEKAIVIVKELIDSLSLDATYPSVRFLLDFLEAVKKKSPSERSRINLNKGYQKPK